MFSALLERFEAHYSNRRPFVLYRKPQEKEVNGILQYDSRVHYVKDFSETGFVFAPFDSASRSILTLADERLRANYLDNKSHGKAIGGPPFIDESQKEFHIDLVKRAIAEIKKDDIQKVVISRRVSKNLNDNLFSVFTRLLSRYGNAYCYLWYHPKVGIWMGATPEILLSTENNLLTTMSLAGTQPYVEKLSPIWGKKEINEQKLVTNYILRELEGRVSGLKISSGLESFRAGELWHLRTKLTGRLEGTLGEVIKSLHPTPAVCGLPKRGSKNFILANENYPREYYTGFLGELNFKNVKGRTSNRRNPENAVYRSIKKTTELYVNLRCMQLVDDRAWIYVGGGITRESDPMKEWEETVAKSATMLSVLG